MRPLICLLLILLSFVLCQPLTAETRKSRLDNQFLDACQAGNLAQARTLIGLGADVNANVADRSSALIYVTTPRDINYDLLNLILTHGANVNARDDLGMTALQWVVCDNLDRSELIDALAKYGATIDVRDEEGKTPLFQAVSGPAPNLKALLRHRANINARDNAGETPLFYVYDVETAQFLVSKGAILDVRAKDGSTPLNSAVYLDRPDLAAYYIEQGASPNALDKSGLAVWMQNLADLDMVKVMLDHGADVNMRTSLGRTGLMMAAAHADTDVVQLLIQHGADVNAKDIKGHTAFTFAASRDDYGRYNIVPILIAAGERDAYTLQRPPDILIPVNSDETNVMLAILRSRYSGFSCQFQQDTLPGGWNGKQFVPSAHFQLPYPGIPVSLFRSMYSSTYPSMVYPVISSVPGVVFARKDDIQTLLRDQDDWSAYYSSGTGGDGYIEMTLPAFDNNRTHALVDVEYMCGGTGSNGNLYYLVKGPSGWTIKYIAPMWIS